MKPFTYTMNDTLVVALSGELDAQMVLELRPFFEECAQGDSNILIDLGDVFFVDSSGVGSLVFLYKRLLENGYSLSLMNVKGQPFELFEMLHLGKAIKCFADQKSFLHAHGGSTDGEQVA